MTRATDIPYKRSEICQEEIEPGQRVRVQERDAVRADVRRQDNMKPIKDLMPAKYKPVTDLSPAAISVGRTLDRLPKGRYLMEFEKTTIRGEGWPINIFTIETIIDEIE